MLSVVARFAIALVLVVATSVAAASDERQRVLDIHRAAVANPDDDAAFEKFLGTLPKVQSPLARDVDLYLIEGDIPFTEKDVRAYLRSKSTSAGVAGGTPELLVHYVAGKPAYWTDRKMRTLRYSVMRASFPSQEQYQKVVKDMRDAANDWTKLCKSCGIKFVHVESHDLIDDPLSYIPMIDADEIRFVVIYSDVAATGNSYIARAFFPGYPSFARTIVIASSYFQFNGRVKGSDGTIIKWTGRGILRHELGHVLGYRHEHILEESGCWKPEGGEWKPLTPYDGKSVMHYRCGLASNQGDLTLSYFDKQGHRKLYGSAK